MIAGVLAGDDVTSPGVLDVSDNDLLGRYFSSPCYTFDIVPTAAAFTIKCDGGDALNSAPNASEVSGIVRTIDQDGDIGTS